jgi:hypothetical protein
MSGRVPAGGAMDRIDHYEHIRIMPRMRILDALARDIRFAGRHASTLVLPSRTALIFKNATAATVVFMPPPVEPGEAPIHINKR